MTPTTHVPPLLDLDAAADPAAHAPNRSGQRVNVLVVDDNEGDAAVLVALLEAAGGDGVRATSVTTLRDALAALDTPAAPDCVLLDLGLPDTEVDSADAVAAIAVRHPRVPVIVVTGQDDDELMLDAIAAGAQDVLAKGTFDGKSLLRRVRFAMGRKRVWWSMFRADQRHRRLLDRAGVGVWLGGRDGEGTYANPRLAALLGLFDDTDVIGRPLTSLVTPEDAAAVATLLAGGTGTSTFANLVRSDGTTVPVSIAVSSVDEPHAVAAFVTDLRGLSAPHAALVGNGWDVISVHNPDGTVTWANPAATRLLGLTTDSVVGTSVAHRIHEEDVDTVNDAFRAWRAGRGAPVSYRLRDIAGGVRHVESVGSNLADHPGIGGIVVTTRDITQRHEAERALAFAALHDGVTRLPNRVLLLDRIRQAIEAARPAHDNHENRDNHDNHKTAAVVFVDIDDFKAVNETRGYEVGDALLAQVGSALATAVRETDTVARIGGDGFAICLRDLASLDDASAIAHALVECVEGTRDIDGEPLYVSVSAGVAVADEHSDADQLLSDAEAAMRRAKERGRGRVAMFDAEARARVVSRLVLQGELRNAITRDELRLHFQPQVRVATGEVVGFEALVRWQHPERGLLPPAMFIDVAEESGLIEPVGQWVLEEACRQIARWRRDFAETRLRVSVNLSARQLLDDSLPDIVDRVLADVGIEPSALCLELTESMLMEDAEHAVATLRRLKETGVRLAIDDFGTGYSSLAYLKRFPIDELKVDRSFVAGLGRDPEDFVIVSAVANLATSLGVEMVAEGVENGRHLAELEALGCPLAQGYLWSPPVPADAVPAFLAGHGAPTAAPLSAAATTAALAPTDTSTTPATAHQAIDVVSLLAHELRAPLTVIKGYAETMSAHLDGASPIAEKACAAITRNVTHLDDLVATLTDVNALEAGTLPLHRQPTDLGRLVHTLLHDHGALFVDGSVEVHVRTGDAEAYADPSRIQQIVLNLLTNAAKFTPAGETVTVLVDGEEDGPDVRVQVVDRGPGVPPELARDVFRKFFRADLTKKGTGLGLYVARSLARAHGGELSCHQAAGGGAEFVLTVPRVNRKRQPVAAGAKTAI